MPDSGDDHAPAVEPAVPHRYLQETLVLDSLVVSIREREPGREGLA